MRRGRPFAVVSLGALAFVAASLSVWPAARGSQGTSFYADCTFSHADGVLRVHINDEEGLVRRRGDQIQILAPTGGSGYETIDCGGTATVHNTDLIRMRIDSDAITTGRLSLRRGPFAPGETPEGEVPEIEMLTFARHEYEELRIEGTRRDDRFRAGQVGGGEWVNLNPNAESAGPDADLKLPSVGRATVGFGMGRGNDAVTVNGGPEFDGPLAPESVSVNLGRGADYYRGRLPHAFIYAGRGADTVVTGRRHDAVLDGRGDDSIRTNAASDAVLTIAGNDRVSTGRGNDLVYAKDGRRDRVNCGRGLDKAALDAFDRARSCERGLE
jgi:hypothetical protein